MSARSAGSVRKRGDRWCFTVDVGTDPTTGKRRQHYRSGFATKREAQAALDEIRQKLHGGEYVEPSTLTIAAFLNDAWLPTRASQVRPSTLESYTRNIRVHVVPQIGTVRLQAISAIDLDRLYATMLAGGSAPRTVRYVHTILSCALKYAVRKNLISRNPATSADPPSVSQAKAPEAKVWSADELRAFLAHVDGERLYALWHTLAATGCRRGEALALRWDDLDLDRRRITIRRARIAIGYSVQEGETKTGRVRAVAIDVDTVSVLREHRKRQAEERLLAGALWQGEGHVFARVDGAPLHPDRVTKLFGAHVRRAGLPRVRLHDVRHTVATLLLESGIHPRAVADRLGHADANLVLRTYGHTLAAHEERAATALGGLLRASQAAL